MKTKSAQGEQGLFITIEGGEGAGKTTLITALAHWLQDAGYRVLTTREPGGIPIAEEIRSVILKDRTEGMDARTEALLYAAARRQHLVEKVLPSLAQGNIVICDRFIDSSLAYQGHARGLGMEQVWAINSFAVGNTLPDLTLWMDVSPEVGLARVYAGAGREINRMDNESSTFHARVREGYRQLHSRYAERICRLNADQTTEQVLSEAKAVIYPHLAGIQSTDV